MTWVLKNEENNFTQGTLNNTQSLESTSHVRTEVKCQNWTEEQRFLNCSVYQNCLEFLLKMQISGSYPGYSNLVNLVWYLGIFILLSDSRYSDEVRVYKMTFLATSDCNPLLYYLSVNTVLHLELQMPKSRCR